VSDEQLERVLDGIPMNRRAFVRRLVLGTAFAVPVVASFGMQTAWAHHPATANQPSGPEYCSTPNQGGPGNTEFFTPIVWERLQIVRVTARQAGNRQLVKLAEDGQHALDACDLPRVRRLIDDIAKRIEQDVRSGKLTGDQAERLRTQVREIRLLFEQNGGFY
jgi:hypothetical protein